MAKRKLPQRGKNGRFLKRGSRARSNPSRKRKSSPTRRRRRSSTRSTSSTRRRRRTYRRNPSVKSIGKDLKQGVMDAGGIVVGEAAARFIPQQFNLPKQGPLGLAVQAGVALVAGMAASKFVGRNFGRMVLAGGLAAPIKTFIVAQNVPVLGPALSPVTSASDLGAYRGYVVPPQTRMAGYVTPPAVGPGGGMGAYAEDAGSYDFAMF